MIHDELTVGEVQAMYFDETSLQLPPVRLYRMEVKGDRHYFSVSEDGKPQFYSGVTTVTGRMIPKDEHLVKWIAQMGYENAISYRNERGRYGTLMHTLFADLLIERNINLDLIDSYVAAYCREHGLEVNQPKWSDDLRQDCVAFVQFLVDYNVRPLAIEISLCSPQDSIAGTADLPCLMDIDIPGEWGELYKSGVNKDKPKITKKTLTFVSIIDFKSGRNYPGGEANAMQLHLYKRLWEANFSLSPSKLIPKEDWHSEDQGEILLFNWSPKDWRTQPGYNLTNQTETVSYKEADMMLEWWNLKVALTPIEDKTKVFFNGVVSLDDKIPGYKNFTTKTVEQIATERVTESADGTPPIDISPWKYESLADLLKDEDEG